MHWKISHLKRSAKRSDGVRISRSRHDIEYPALPGWGVWRGLRLLGMYPEQAIEEVMAKVDAAWPEGSRVRTRGSFLADWYCPSCIERSLVVAERRMRAYTVTCGHCAFQADPEHLRQAVEMEVYPRQVISRAVLEPIKVLALP